MTEQSKPVASQPETKKSFECDCGTDPKHECFIPPWAHAEDCPYRTQKTRVSQPSPIDQMAREAVADGTYDMGPETSQSARPRTPDPDSKRGIYEKFTVARNFPSEKHVGCRYFVLDITHDAFALPALRAYADACKKDYPVLAYELGVVTSPTADAEPTESAAPTTNCPACSKPIAFDTRFGWYHVDVSASNCSGVRDIPWPESAASPEPPKDFAKLLRECMETAVRLAFSRHNIEIDPDLELTEEDVAADAAGACFGEESCDDNPIPEVTELLKLAAASSTPVETEDARTKLMGIAARIARREYLPSLERCVSLNAAAREISKMDDRHGKLAMELKAEIDKLRATDASASSTKENK